MNDPPAYYHDLLNHVYYNGARPITFLLLFAVAFFLIFSVLHVFADLLRVQTNRINTITTCPEVISPIGLSLQMSKLVQNSNR